MTSQIGNKEQKIKIIRLSEKTYYLNGHPFNIDFLSKELEILSVAERDLLWTEYTRKISEQLLNFVGYYENVFKLNGDFLNSEEIHFGAKKIMWYLTSTNRLLRDSATRSLYYYGRQFPEKLFELVKYSLTINDPYIQERTLAALYGVTLAKFSDDSFTKKILGKISTELFKLMFEFESPYSTTHIVIRDYARRIIECGLIHNKLLLQSKEISRLRPPYKDGGTRNWPKHKDDFANAEFGPILMDFENYQIGYIVKDGHSYDNPPEKRKVRGNIYWRIYQLGWSRDSFEAVDKEILNYNYRQSRSDRAKVERYGKKYSWIAYFEIAGYRTDLGLLERGSDDYRFSDVDIDPTFPEPPLSAHVFKMDLLGDRSLELLKWLKNKIAPDFKQYLQTNEIANYKQEWICLDGFISQKDTKYKRQMFGFIRPMLVSNKYW